MRLLTDLRPNFWCQPSLHATRSAHVTLQIDSYNMKRSMAGPQGQSSSPNKRPRIRTEEDFQQAFARILDVPDFPAEPPLLVAGPESLVRVPTLEAEKEIERLLGRDAQAEPIFANSTDARNRSEIPKEFTAELKRKYQRGEFDAKVLGYYSDILPQGDSTTVPGQGGRALLLKSIMRQEDAMPSAMVAGPAWRPVRPLGKGGFGEGMSVRRNLFLWTIVSSGRLMSSWRACATSWRWVVTQRRATGRK